MSTETTSRARRPYDVRQHPQGSVIMSDPSEHATTLGLVFNKGPGSYDYEEMAQIWAWALPVMFPALAKIRNAATAAANGQLYQTVEDLRDLLSSIALVASNALPVPTIGDTQGSTQPAQVFASGTAATLGHLDVNGESRFGTFIEMTPDECRGVAIGDLLGRRVALVPTEDLAEAVLPAAPDPTSAPDLSEFAKRLACAAYRVGFPSASTDDLERMWNSLTDEGRAPWIAAAQEVPRQVEWLHPSLAPTKQGTPILLKVQLHDGSHIAEGHVTEEGRLWVPSIAYTRGDPNVLGVIPLCPLRIPVTAALSTSQDPDQDAWHITSGSIQVESATGPKIVGAGHVVIPEARYQALLAQYRATQGNSLTATANAPEFHPNLTAFLRHLWRGAELNRLSVEDEFRDLYDAALAGKLEASQLAVLAVNEVRQSVDDPVDGLETLFKAIMADLSSACAVSPTNVVDIIERLKATGRCWDVSYFPELGPEPEFNIAPENHFRVNIVTGLEDEAVGWGATLEEAGTTAISTAQGGK